MGGASEMWLGEGIMVPSGYTKILFFIVWLTIHNILVTADRMEKWNKDTQNYVFFAMSVTKHVTIYFLLAIPSRFDISSLVGSFPKTILW